MTFNEIQSGKVLINHLEFIVLLQQLKWFLLGRFFHFALFNGIFFDTAFLQKPLFWTYPLTSLWNHTRIINLSDDQTNWDFIKVARSPQEFRGLCHCRSSEALWVTISRFLIKVCCFMAAEGLALTARSQWRMATQHHAHSLLEVKLTTRTHCITQILGPMF